MKRIALCFVLLVAAISLKAQTFLIDDFVLSSTEGAYGIYANIDCNESNVILIDMQGPNEEQHVQMELYYIEYFRSSLEKARKEFVEWSKIAKENDVKSFSKKMNTTVMDMLLYFTVDGKWYVERGVDFEWRFLVSPEGECFLVLQSDYMTSEEPVAHGYSVGSSFNMMTGRWGIGFASSTTSIIRYCSGASLVFSSPEEIDMLSQKIYDAQMWKTNNIGQSRLFKMVK